MRLVNSLKRAPDLATTWVQATREARRHRELFAGVETYCMFIGYPRSGHSLVGSLLDAHRHAVIAHELDALSYLGWRFGRRQVWALILDRDADFGQRGRRWTNYDYAVPGQHQGRWDELKVIGDKKGGASTRRLDAQPHLLDVLLERMEVPARFVHVVRNPYDNIATMFTRNHKALAPAVERYEQLAATNADLRRRLGDAVLDVRHEGLLAEPGPTLRSLCEHVGLDAPDDYLQACAGILFPEPRRTRASAPWTPELVDRVARLIDRHEFLAGYRFDS